MKNIFYGISICLVLLSSCHLKEMKDKDEIDWSKYPIVELSDPTRISIPVRDFEAEQKLYLVRDSLLFTYATFSQLSELHLYRLQRDIILSCIKKHPNYDKVKIKEENSGLHFLLEVDTDLSDEQLINNAKKHGIIISCLSQYSYLNHNASTHTIFINYSAINHDDICEAVDRLFRCLW